MGATESRPGFTNLLDLSFLLSKCGQSSSDDSCCETEQVRDIDRRSRTTSVSDLEDGSNFSSNRRPDFEIEKNFLVLLSS